MDELNKNKIEEDENEDENEPEDENENEHKNKIENENEAIENDNQNDDAEDENKNEIEIENKDDEDKNKKKDEENEFLKSHQHNQSASPFTMAADGMPGLDESHIKIGSWLEHYDDAGHHAISIGLFLSKIHQDILASQANIRDELMDQIDTIKDNIINNVMERVQERLDSGEVRNNTSTSHHVSGSKSILPWKPKEPLKKLTFQLACQHIITSNVEAYTALVRKPNKTVIENSLYKKIKRSILQQGILWCTEQLPPKPNGIVLTADTQHLATMIKEKAKHTQENLHTALLTGIKPDCGCQRCTRSIPDLHTLVGLIVQVGKEENESKSDDDIWHDADMLSRTRFAYLRRECLRLYFPDKATSTIWTVVDSQLGYLLSKGRPHTACFCNLIYQQDRNRFDSGSVMYDSIPRAKQSFKLPSDDKVQAEILNLQSRRPNKKANKKPIKNK